MTKVKGVCGGKLALFCDKNEYQKMITWALQESLIQIFGLDGIPLKDLSSKRRQKSLSLEIMELKSSDQKEKFYILRYLQIKKLQLQY